MTPRYDPESVFDKTELGLISGGWVRVRGTGRIGKVVADSWTKYKVTVQFGSSGPFERFWFKSQLVYAKDAEVIPILGSPPVKDMLRIELVGLD